MAQALLVSFASMTTGGSSAPLLPSPQPAKENKRRVAAILLMRDV